MPEEGYYTCCRSPLCPFEGKVLNTEHRRSKAATSHALLCDEILILHGRERITALIHLCFMGGLSWISGWRVLPLGFFGSRRGEGGVGEMERWQMEMAGVGAVGFLVMFSRG